MQLNQRITRQPLRILFITATGILGGIVTLLSAAAWLEVPSIQQPADAVVVLGGDYPYRILEGIKIYQLGEASELWFTGDGPRNNRPFSYGEFALRIANQRKVPPEDAFVLASNSTWQDAEKTLAFAQQRGITSITVVTSWYHSRRTTCVFKRQFTGSNIALSFQSAKLYPAPLQNWWRTLRGWRAVTREFAAIVYYWLRYDLAPWNC